MSLLIGVDEAGYGPNLGPLVVAATVWEVPDDPRKFDLWGAFDGVVSERADPTGRTVQVADSKSIHSPAAGIAALERSATVLLRLAGLARPSLFSLWDELTGRRDRVGCGEPWFTAEDLPLPIASPPDAAAELADRWRTCCAESGCRLVAVGCDVVTAGRFNDGVARTGGKGGVLSQTTLSLIRRFWSPNEPGPALILCDKHGGRNRYGELLAEAFPEEFPLRLEESREVSRYRVGAAEIRFQVRSERHLPVAAASVVAKYLREASMAAFNRFWSIRMPGLRPTAGYPTDAKRFLTEIEGPAAALGLPRDSYWRLK